MYFIAAAIAYALYIFISGPPSGQAPVLTAPKKGELRHRPDHVMPGVYPVVPAARA